MLLSKNKELIDQAIKNAKYITLGELLDSIGHQLKQPLQVISMISQMMLFKIKLDEIEKDEFKQNLLKINEQIDYANDVINTFRNFLRENKRQKVKLSNIIKHLKSLLKEVIHLNSVELKEEFDDDMEIFVDESRFLNIFINLMTNSIYKCKEKNISCIITIKAYNKGNYQIIEFIDNAGGIKDKEILKRIFDINFTTKKDGSGMGLYMTKMILDKIDATIEAENFKDGLRFIITLKKE